MNSVDKCLCDDCIHKYVCRHNVSYVFTPKGEFVENEYTKTIKCSHYIKGEDVGGQMVVESEE